MSKNFCEDYGKVDVEKLVLFFDMKDICIAYKKLNEPVIFMMKKNEFDIVDKGAFKLRSDYCPLGRPCDMVWEEHRKNKKLKRGQS